MVFNFPKVQPFGFKKLLPQHAQARYIIENLLKFDPNDRKSARWAL